MRFKNHWLQLTKPLAMSISLEALATMIFVAYRANNPSLPPPPVFPFIIVLIIGFLPVAWGALQMSFTSYYLNDGVVRMEEGILSRMALDIPISKINDITVRQGLIQRLFGAGDLILMTGNDSGAYIRSIREPYAARDAINRREK